MKKIFLPLLFVAIIVPRVFSQVNVKDSSIFTPIFYATYSFQIPGGGIAQQFGSNSSIGGGFMLKFKSNWLLDFEGNFLFGGDVKGSDTLLKNICTPDGYLIDANGYYSDIAYYERGFSFLGKIGKLIPIWPNPNSGILIMAGGGFEQHKIRIHLINSSAPQLEGDYVKGYDRLNNGPAITGSIGYMYLGSQRLTNAYIGFEFMQSWTQNRRDMNFDTQKKDAKKYTNQFYGIKICWMIPVYKRTPQNYYLY
ncbi:MAG: hypothetical protein Q8867_07395 [Bacteroidota bacterium]|nr:hypothetical protein [Bacteroidota bacterium]